MKRIKAVNDGANGATHDFDPFADSGATATAEQSEPSESIDDPFAGAFASAGGGDDPFAGGDAAGGGGGGASDPFGFASADAVDSSGFGNDPFANGVESTSDSDVSPFGAGDPFGAATTTTAIPVVDSEGPEGVEKGEKIEMEQPANDPWAQNGNDGFSAADFGTEIDPFSTSGFGM